MAAALVFLTIGFGLVGHKYLEFIILEISKVLRSYKTSTKSGRELQVSLRKHFGNQQGSKLLPQYKFFTPFAHELRELQLRHGLSSKSLMQSLRPWLTKDIQFEEKIQAILKNSLLQFLILSSFTWIFYFNATRSLECELPWGAFAFLQVAGFICFLFIFQLKRKFYFSGLDEVFKRQFLLQSLKSVGLSMGEVLGRSEADHELVVKDEQVKEHSEHLMKICQAWVKEGRSIDSELEELSSELSYLREEKRKAFEINLTILRFIHLVGFYLVGYLLVVLGLIRQLALSY